ncbi:MAG: alcohol dehydrogenase catalytic domain-containing protein [Myxococcales bacterium]|nr:alcohol dehydrogenase catalytic domain-containing protein [Myxococcales bacterium]
MRQLVHVKPGQLEWRDVPEPKLAGPREALARPIAVARCDVDPLMYAGKAPVVTPYAIGHECIAEILQVGTNVSHVEPGDRVAVSFEIACGECELCRRGWTSACSTAGPHAMYGFGEIGGTAWGGMLADVIRVPFADAMCVKVTETLPAVTLASLGDNVCDGFRCVAPFRDVADRTRVLVVGGIAQSIGLYAVACAKALGFSEVAYLDDDPVRRTIAEQLGANVGEESIRSTRYAVTVDASSRPEGLREALGALAPGGTCTSVGIYYEDVALPLAELYSTGVHFHTGHANACHSLPAVVELLTAGKLDLAAITTRVVEWDAAADTMGDPTPKLVFARDEALREIAR